MRINPSVYEKWVTQISYVIFLFFVPSQFGSFLLADSDYLRIQISMNSTLLLLRRID